MVPPAGPPGGSRRSPTVLTAVTPSPLWSLSSRSLRHDRAHASCAGPGPRRGASVARQILLLQVLSWSSWWSPPVALAAYDARRDARETATERAVAVAETVADSPAVRRGASPTTDPSPSLQPLRRAGARRHRRRLRRRDGPRPHPLQPPRPGHIGKPFVGDLGDAPRGPRLHPGVHRHARPLDARRGAGARRRRRGGAGLGRHHRGRDRRAAARRPGADRAGRRWSCSAAGSLGAWLVSRRLRRQTHGMGEREITRMYEYYSAVLHAVREGLLLLDGDGRVQLVNDEARRLLDLPDDVVGPPVDDLGLAPGLVAAALGRTAESDDIYVAGDRVLVVSSAPARGRAARSAPSSPCATTPSCAAVTGELDVVRGLTESLRAQTHEAANRLHTVVSLIEMGRADEAVDFATEELAGRPAADRPGRRRGRRPGRGGAAARQDGGGGRARHRARRSTGDLPDGPACPRATWSPCSATWSTTPSTRWRQRRERRVAVRLGGDADGRRVVASGDSGPGLDEAEAGTRSSAAGPPRPRATGGRGVGLALVAQVARRHGGDGRGRPLALGGAELDGHPPARSGTVRAPMTVRVLVVEDEALAAEAHATYVERVPGFELAGVARSAGDAARVPAPRGDGRPGPARHAPARRARARAAAAAARRRPPRAT